RAHRSTTPPRSALRHNRWMPSEPTRVTPERRRGVAARRLLPVVAVAAGVAAACSTSYDAGDTAEEQLCDVLRTAIETSDAGEDLRLESLLDAAATDPTEVPTELLAVALSYRTHE